MAGKTMIGYLRGEIMDHSDGKLLIAVGAQSPSAVGYAVSVPLSPNYLGWVPGKVVEVFIHTHVREDALDLYGFASRIEKDLFLTLLSVNGIGPKGAMGILSKVEPDALIQAIVEGDKEALTKIPGIGKKTAERVVLELADPIKKKVEQGIFALSRPSGATAAAGVTKGANRSSANSNPVVQDAKDALLSLGYREQDIGVLLDRALADFEVQPTRAEDLIRTALRQLV